MQQLTKSRREGKTELNDNYRNQKKKNYDAGTYMLNDLALVVAGSEVIKIDSVFNVGLQVADEFDVYIGLEKSASDLIEALAEDLLVHSNEVVQRETQWSLRTPSIRSFKFFILNF